MGRLMRVATCQLNQWALDWEGNTARIKESVKLAIKEGAKLRVGPELELSSYMCQDHFLEHETYTNCWDMLATIMMDRDLDGIIIDLGMPVMHKNNRFNCRVIILNGKVLLLRPKLWVADDGNYREARWFVPWSRPRHVEQFDILMEAGEKIAELQGSRFVPIGDAVIRTLDTVIGCETCEELFTPMSPHNTMCLDGVEVITNSSGSHHALRKLDTRISLIGEATVRICGAEYIGTYADFTSQHLREKNPCFPSYSWMSQLTLNPSGGVYLYSNLSGGDGDRLLFDGCSMVFVNGEIVAQCAQFSLRDVEVAIATIDIEEVRSYRSAPARALQSIANPHYQRIDANLSLSSAGGDMNNQLVPCKPRPLKVHSPEEEIALGPAAWLWDYLRRSGQKGFLIPLSGGIDSCATATLVFSACRMAFQACKDGTESVIQDVRRLCSIAPGEPLPKSPQEIASKILSTVYMGMEKQSSQETRGRAKALADAIGAQHVDMNIDPVFNAMKEMFQESTGFSPRFRLSGGSDAENLALQNIQARQRMVTAYLFAQLLPTVRGGKGGLLVLGSGNVDECLRGYLTKYDCSSADINPIGSISKVDLRSFIQWASTNFDVPILQSFVDATPTAELEPITEEYVQSDEVDMGMTYEELSVFGRLRKEKKMGPFAMFERLLHDWRDKYTPREVGDKVKRFYHYYAINRHKMTTMTPAYHAEAYSPDDNRFDLRPFLYPPSRDNWSFKKIDEKVAEIEKRKAGGK